MHQIGKSFTRLQSAIRFHEPSALTDTDALCILGDPPPEFDPVHSRSLINAWYRALQSCLADPVQVERRRGHRRVQVLGQAIFDFNPDGQLDVYGWYLAEDDRIALGRLDSWAVVVQTVPFGTIWAQRIQMVALHVLQREHPAQTALCQTYTEWAQGKLMALCWTADVQDAVRYRIAVELELDAEAMQVAARIQLGRFPRSPFRADVYNHAIRHRDGYATLDRDAPQLVPLYALLADELCRDDPDSNLELTAQMREYLLDREIGPAAWRMLYREGTEWMGKFQSFYELDQQSVADVAVDLLRVAQEFGTAKLAPGWLMHAFMQLGGNPNAPAGAFAKRLDDLFGLCARMGNLVLQADDDQLRVLRHRCQDIFNWASANLAGMPEGFTRRATVTGLIRRVEQHQAKEVLRLRDAEAWQVPYQSPLTGSTDLRAVILDSPLAVWEEGRVMRHCADRYIDTCARGDWLMVSLRSIDRRRPVATVAFDLQADKVTLKKIAGFANNLVEPEVWQVAKECARHLQLQRSRARSAPESCPPKSVADRMD